MRRSRVRFSLWAPQECGQRPISGLSVKRSGRPRFTGATEPATTQPPGGRRAFQAPGVAMSGWQFVGYPPRRRSALVGAAHAKPSCRLRRFGRAVAACREATLLPARSCPLGGGSACAVDAPDDAVRYVVRLVRVLVARATTGPRLGDRAEGLVREPLRRLWTRRRTPVGRIGAIWRDRGGRSHPPAPAARLALRSSQSGKRLAASHFTKVDEVPRALPQAHSGPRPGPARPRVDGSPDTRSGR